MPRNVRNFWLVVTVDGRETRIECGPQAKDGGFNARIYMRRDGEVWEAANLNGRPEDGKLALVYVTDAGAVSRIETTR